MHIARGMEPPKMRTELVNQLIKGKEHRETAIANTLGTAGRRPITPDILLLLKARLSDWDAPAVDQRMMWAVCTNLFFGAFRGIELLAREEHQFDPAYTLLAEDIAVVPDNSEPDCWMVQYRIKSPKECKKGATVIVDVFHSQQNICPVLAIQKWRNAGGLAEIGQPGFRWSDGKPLTSKRFNEMLKDRLTGYIDGGEKLYSSHSFRAGAASMLATLGYSDSDIKALGKWNSRAFESYIKAPRSKRAAVAKKFSKIKV